ncbi:MAG: membrane protein insertase YidC [Cyclobacteriaceae bacterium]|nr:membrane protein insertase YidC [Cyclobacteriaceae bacterium]
MDRNSAIGLTLIAVLLLVYFNMVDTPQKPDAAPATVSSELADTTQKALDVTVAVDSARLKNFGSLANYLSGQEEEVKIESADLTLVLSSKGRIHSVELRNFKTYQQQPLFLATPATNRFSLVAKGTGSEVDLYQLFYTKNISKKGDSTVVQFSAAMGSGYVRHIYTIPPAGFQFKYQLETRGVAEIGNQNLVFRWEDNMPLVEKDLNDSRSKSTINYYLANGEFDRLAQASSDLEEAALTGPVKWISVRQKFFISSIIAENPFAGGEVSTIANPQDTETVKKATIEAYVPMAESGTARFTYFFGPNDYDIISGVTPGFDENLDLGFPPMSWINRFVIIPIFNFLQQFIGNYGIIIIILVLFVKLILLPLSYRSYLGMAKMRLLKPELDAIKEKNGDNMAQAQQDQMKLYQQAGVNPFSGCIPLLLQMPILFAMFYFFPISIDLRQQPFLWAEDLSTYDSILSLPFTIPFYGSHVSLFTILMTISTLIYTWQNNQISSVQGPMKSLSYIMPVVFMFVLNSFSAGLSFYYFVSNLVTFAQQAIIKRFVDEDKILAIMEENKKKAATGTGKKSKFMTKLEEAMKASEEARKNTEQSKKGKKK